MQNLAEQILDRVPKGRTVDRAQLALGANYDSVGRVLRQLVAERIERQIGRSTRNVFLRADFAKLGSYDAVGRALRQLVEGGRLVQISYGLYAKAERSPFTGKPAPVVGIRRLATEALGRLGKSVVASTTDAAYNSGRSTQVPTGRAVGVKDRVRRRIGYDGTYVVLERA